MLTVSGCAKEPFYGRAHAQIDGFSLPRGVVTAAGTLFLHCADCNQPRGTRPGGRPLGLYIQFI